MQRLGDALRWVRRSTAILEPVTPPPLPDTLLGESVSVKLLWAYLRSKGVVAFSSYGLGAALGLSQGAANARLARLRELRLVKTLGERRTRARAVYQVVDQGGNPASSPTRDPPHLPEILKGETPTTRLVYVYLEPFGEVEVSVRQLETLLGIAHRNAAEALQQLVELGLLKVLEPATSRPGRYQVRASA